MFSSHAVIGAVCAFAAACAHTARAGEIVSNEVFSSGTSVETLMLGAFDPNEPEEMDFEEGCEDKLYYWLSSSGDDVGQVKAYDEYYAESASYDYAAHGLVRKSCFAKGLESTQGKFLVVTEGDRLDRGIFGRGSTNETAFTNIVVRNASRESIYCDLVAKFSLCEASPTLDPDERIAVWVRGLEDDHGDVTTNLMVTAGFFTNEFTAAVSREYRLDISEVCPDGLDFSKWYRLTIRAHGAIGKGSNASQQIGVGFSVYLDGKPLRVVEEDCPVCDASSLRKAAKRLSPEARALMAERRLLPNRARPTGDQAFTLSRFTFSGIGSVDDISFSSEDPGYAKAESVWTLNWGSGITKLEYTLDGGLTTNAVAVSAARSTDILLGNAATNGLVLKVLACDYDTALGYKAGVWLGSNGATVTNGTEFVFDGSTRNPIATVASTREQLNFGDRDTPADTFASAFAALDRSTNAVKTLCLCRDMTLSYAESDSYQNSDRGYVNITNANGEYVLDLNGHTLRGTNPKNPTLVVGCKSLRIVDSSEPDPATKLKKGRIYPVESYTNENPCLSTAVHIYPRAAGEGKNARLVEPVVTLQDGIYDGWVVNQANLDAVSPAVGTVYVEGGRYISTDGAAFYLDSCVTNPSLQYVYRDRYWLALTNQNMIIWTGLGDGRRWVDPANWKARRVPTSSETALFPSRALEDGPWPVDVETNLMTTKSLALEGNVFLMGTNDFIGVTAMEGGNGRICGDATLLFEGDQPGQLTETLLATNWAGTVLLRKIGTGVPKVLKNLEAWGTADSKVVFNGVRGYVMDVKSHTMPYTLVLEDLVTADSAKGTVVTNLAWQNDSGYTGSTLAFKGGLAGDGTFQSGANRRPVLQLFKFANVTNFTGRFCLGGKRVLLGNDTELPALPGLLAFGDQVAVSTDLDWLCTNAVFSGTIYVTGETNRVLVTCRNEPDVSTCTNLVLNGYSGIAWLASTNNPRWTVYVSGEKPASDSVSSKKVYLASDVRAAAVAPKGNDNGYSAAALSASLAAVNRLTLALASEAVERADVSLEVHDGVVEVTVKNVECGLWYGLRHRASLADDWDPPSEWKWVQPTGSSASFIFDVTADTGFYGVVITNEDPQSSESGGADD